MKLLSWIEVDETAPAGGRRPRLDAVGLRPAGGAGARPGADWWEEVVRWNLRCGAEEAVASTAREVLRGGGSVVVTGQQPGLLGGPLYTLYKLLTAVETAREIEARTGRPSLAVFWIVGDDSDFGEVSWTLLPRRDGAVERLREARVPQTGTLVGGLPASRQAEVLAGSSDPAWGVLGTRGAASGSSPAERRDPGRAPAEERDAGRDGSGPFGAAAPLVAEALAVGRTWSGVTAALLFRALPALRALFIDGAHPAVLAAQQDWLAEAGRWPLPALLAEGAEEARAAGFEPAFAPEVGERALFRIEGDRREPWAGPDPADALLAPNVVLRPLVQDLLLPNAATIGGPGEIRYRAQLGPVYRHAGIPAPPVLPRLRAALLPALGSAIGPEELAAENWRSLRDPDGWIDALAAERAPRELADGLAAVRRELRARLEGLAPAAAAFDASLGQLLESARGKADFQLGRVEEGVHDKARRLLLRREPALAQWRAFVRPKDGEQERALNLLAPLLLEGAGAMEALRAAAREHAVRFFEGSGPGAAARQAVLQLEAPGEEKG